MSRFRYMRMNRIVLFLAGCLAASSLAAQVQPARPKIMSIHHVRLYVSNLEKSRAFYGSSLGLFPTDDRCAGASRPCFATNSGSNQQHVELEQMPSPAPKTLLAEVAFLTDNLPQMRRYLVAHGVIVGPISKDSDGTRHFELRDPEGNPIAFVGSSGPLPIDDPPLPNWISTRLLHAGFVVKDLAAENRFYMGLLGFRLYWYGGFKDQDTDWYEIQVPDGDNWIEYMLNIPANADHKELGVQNHFSLGVKDVQAAAAQLRKNGLQTFDGPEIGRDGKNSLDAYDPDGTRIEVMEFTPTQKPCCHPYTAPHPKP
jgi:catechol 2,3-dioxygenase-like lactoylglutathione lyase family enzyme